MDGISRIGCTNTIEVVETKVKNCFQMQRCGYVLNFMTQTLQIATRVYIDI